MPENIRALIVVLFLATPVFYFMRLPAYEFIGARVYNRRRNLWFGVTLIMFLANNYWLFIAATWLLLFFSMSREKNKVALFFFLLFAVPGGGIEIPGFGLVNYFFVLDHPRFLALCIFLPMFLHILTRGKKSSSRNNTLDIIVLCYVALCVFLEFRGNTFTNGLRGSFYQFVDIYLPYFVISRSLSNMDEFKDALFSYITVILVLSVLGVFELLKNWHLYTSAEYSLGMVNVNSYLQRSGFLRAYVSLEIIALGYVIAIGLGFNLFFLDLYPKRPKFLAIACAIVAGLISPLSRGPWVGAAVLVATYIFFSPNRLRRLSLLAGACALFVVVISFTPFGKTLYGLIPFIGETESGTLTYRQRVVENSWIVILRNPLLGSVDYLLTPEMEALRQGQGIIDVVNTYVSRALKYGFVGLSLFFGIFLIACLKVFTSFTRFRQIDPLRKKPGQGFTGGSDVYHSDDWHRQPDLGYSDHVLERPRHVFGLHPHDRKAKNGID